MATSPSSFPKQPYEQFVINFDFKKQLAVSGSSIISKTVIGTINGTDSTVTSDIISGSSISSDKQSVDVGVKGGVDGKIYKITVKVTTDAYLPDGTSSEDFEGETLMICSDL